MLTIGTCCPPARRGNGCQGLVLCWCLLSFSITTGVVSPPMRRSTQEELAEAGGGGGCAGLLDYWMLDCWIIGLLATGCWLRRWASFVKVWNFDKG